MKRTLTVSFLSIFLAIAAQSAIAQNQQGNDNSMLPEIDPQDIEIRSQFKARFPGLRRQPILGFEPTSRVYKIDPNRMPYIETGEDVVADLPVSELSRPEPPAYTGLNYAPDINAFGRFGFGSYASPVADFWGFTRLSDRSYIGGDLDFSSSEGHLDNQTSSFRNLEANAEFAAKLDEETRLGFNLGLENSFNHLFNVNSTTLTVPDSPRKEYGGFNFGGELQRLKNGVAGWKLQANARYYQAELMAGDLSGTTDEGVYNASFSKRWAGSHLNETFTLKLGGTLGDYSNDVFADQWMTGQLGVVYSRMFNYETNITLDASVYYGSDAFDDKVYFGPNVTVEQPIFEGALLTVEAGARPYVKTAEQLHTINRFLSPRNFYRHSYLMFGDASLQLKYSEVGSLKGGIRYEDIADYPIFERAATSSGEELFYQVRYADVTKFRLYAGATHQFVPEKFWLSGEVYAQLPELKNGDRIPFTEKLGLKAGFGLRLFDRATIKGWADYTGPRKTADQESLKDYILLGGQLDIAITDRIGIYGKAVNLLDQQYQQWEGYIERPLQIYGGITLKL